MTQHHDKHNELRDKVHCLSEPCHWPRCTCPSKRSRVTPSPLPLSKRIENMFSFLYAAEKDDPCHFDHDFLDEVKAAALRGAAPSHEVTTERMLLTEIDEKLDELGVPTMIENGDGLRLSRVGRISLLAQSATRQKHTTKWGLVCDKLIPLLAKESLTEDEHDAIASAINYLDECDGIHAHASSPRLKWLEDNHTLHRSVEILYVVDGYEVTVMHEDGVTELSPRFRGETLAAAIDSAMNFSTTDGTTESK